MTVFPRGADSGPLIADGGVAAASPGDGGPGSGADPWAIIDVIADAIRDEGQPGGQLPADRLPGFGSERMTCGDPRTCFCGDCAKTHDSRTTCDKSECPHCAPNWARKRATFVCRKLAALRAMLDATERGHQKLHHVVVSPGDGVELEGVDPDAVRDRGFEAVYDIMDELGLQGIAIYHPYRGKESDDRGFWKDILFHHHEWDDVFEEIEWSPHFHIIGVSDFVDGQGVTDVVEPETGWVIHRITQGNSAISVGDNLALARVVTYCLSHVGIYSTESGNNRYAGRWHGDDVHGVTPPEKYEMEWERIIRTVSTRTLGLNKKDLLCSGRDVVNVQTSIGTYNAAQASMSDDASSSASTSTGGGETPAAVDGDETVMPDVPDVKVTKEGGEDECEGPLLDIARAPEFLQDDEWCEQAPYADDLRDAYKKWQVTQDFKANVERDLGLIQEGRADEARIDWPPPD